MINRVQAFNNKNNYNQSFGMSLLCPSPIARRTTNKIANSLGHEGKLELKKVLDEISLSRASDKHVDIVIEEGSQPDQVVFQIRKKHSQAEDIIKADDTSCILQPATENYGVGGMCGQLLAVSRRAERIDQVRENMRIREIDVLESVSQPMKW